MKNTKELPIESFVRYEMFLFVCSDWYDTFKSLETLDKITDTIGFSDVNDLHSFQIYRVLRNSVRPIEFESSLTECTVKFYDDGELIYTGDYDEH